MSSFFFPEQRSINQIFERGVSYLIPEYQRPYSWECVGKSEKNNQINVMWEDLYEDAFTDSPDQLYFFGSMVVIGKNNNLQFEVVDGQQRLTSLALLFVAIRCFLLEQAQTNIDADLVSGIKDMSSALEEILYNKKRIGAMEASRKVKIERSAGFDFDSMLDDVFSCKSLDVGSYKIETDEQRDVVKRYFDNRKFFETAITRAFLGKGIFTTDSLLRLNEFIEFMLNRVFVVNIRTESFERAYHIFEILNNRGLPLSSKDLLRNKILKEFDTLKNSGNSLYRDVSPFAKWQELEDTGTFDTEFISRWVESYTTQKQKKTAYTDLVDIYDKSIEPIGIKPKIEVLHNDLLTTLGYYDTIINNKFKDSTLRQRVNVILNAGNTRFSINFLLTAMKLTKGEETQEFKEIVRYFEINIWGTHLNYYYSSASVFRWMRYIKGGRIDEFKKDIGVATQRIDDWRKQFLKISNEAGKLALAKYIWMTEEKIGTDDTVDQTLLFDKCSLEHIYPQNPAKGTNWLSSDFAEMGKGIGIYSLGNMTLLTWGKNSKAKNSDFKKKKEVYALTKLTMTTELATLPDNKMNYEYLEKRHEKIVSTILKDLEL